MKPGWKCYHGVLHVHLDGNGRPALDAILEAANAEGLDFVVVTEVGEARESLGDYTGWHGGVLVMASEEVYAPDGHFLAFETPFPIGEVRRAEHGIEEVRHQSGLVAGTHYHYRDVVRPAMLAPPLPFHDVDLVEIWSFMDEFLANVRGNRALQFQVRPERALIGPPLPVVRDWDAAQLDRPIPAFAGINAHVRKQPLLEWRELFPYRASMRTLRTSVFCPEIPHNHSRAADQIWKALRQGHSFMSNRTLGDPAGFDFRYLSRKGEQKVMGETARYAPGARVEVTLPQEAEVVIRVNSLPLLWATGQKISFPAPSPGIYRVEVRLERRVWIFSNAIRVLTDEDDQSRNPTVGDFT
jgi:hypothetical protein